MIFKLKSRFLDARINAINFMKKLGFIQWAALAVFLVALGFVVSYHYLDPDLGWHLKSGELILERGIPQQDWYSYSMPDFPWINHEWLTDVVMFWVYSVVGIHGVSFIYILFFTLAFFVVARKEHPWLLVAL